MVFGWFDVDGVMMGDSGIGGWGDWERGGMGAWEICRLGCGCA